MHLGGDREAGDDDVGARRVEPRNRPRAPGATTRAACRGCARAPRAAPACRARGRRTACPRAARCMPARLVNVPPDPMSCAPRQSRTGSTSRDARRARVARSRLQLPRASARSPRNSSVRRSAPNGNDTRRSTRPSALSASSSDPPPMSITTARPHAEVEVRERAAEARAAPRPRRSAAAP